MQAGAQMVLAMGYSVTVSAAELMMSTLYAELFGGRDLSTALCRARRELYSQKGRRAYFNQTIDLEDWLLPVAYQNREVQLARREFTAQEQAAYYQRKAERYPFPRPQYGFVGRDLDILEIEKRLLQKRNVLLVSGMGGAGKTTLLQHLGAWWQRTHFVDEVFYFGYDERAWTRQQILECMGKKLLSGEEYARFQPMSLEAQQALLAERLRARRHLLMLDNLESITGSHLAIRNTLPREEQEGLRGLLGELVGGLTLVLLGSRSREEWLTEGTFGENVYELPGLDPEAASDLAEEILKRYEVTQYRQEEDFERLLKLLDGYPLPLEVVLANLAQQTPQQVLAALEAGDVGLDRGDTQKKTESIVRCIDYSYSNLSPEGQGLLASLAPFTSVVNQKAMAVYQARLKEQPALAKLDFDRWPEVIEEATNWGLLRPDPEAPDYLRLQPILPYFLRGRLQGERKQAVETAFRQHYDAVSSEIHKFQHSNLPGEKVLSQAVAALEYENLMACLKLGLQEQGSIMNPYVALYDYLDANQDHRRVLELTETVRAGLEGYSADKLTGKLGIDLALVVFLQGRCLLNLKRYPEADATCRKALELLVANKNLEPLEIKQNSAAIYAHLGRVAKEQRHWTQADKYYQQALAILIETNDRLGQASTYHQLGWLAQEQRQWAKAEQCYQKSLAVKIELNDSYGQAATYHNLGMVAQEQQQWVQAEQNYQKALKIKRKFNYRREQASTYLMLGIVAQHGQKRTQAEQYYQNALEIQIEFNDRYEQACTYHNLGTVAQEQQQWVQAEQYYQKALDIRIDFNDRLAEAQTYHMLGMVAHMQRQWAQAEQYYQKALAIKIELNDCYAQATTYHQLGCLAEEQQQWAKARDYLIKALETYRAYEDSQNFATVLASLARTWSQSGDRTIPEGVARVSDCPVEQAEERLHILSVSNRAPASCGQIHDAAANGDLEKVRALLQDDPDLVMSKDKNGLTPLHRAAKNGHADVTKLLLANKAEINAKTSAGRTPLHDAAERGHKDLVELLLINKANINEKTYRGYTALHLAAFNGYMDVVDLLLDHGADVNAKSNLGTTPLLTALAHKDVAELLRQHGGHE
jgi:tetratricopeptide (TPR) repeat protein